MTDQTICRACGNDFLLEDAYECPWCLAPCTSQQTPTQETAAAICDVDPWHLPVEAVEPRESDRFGHYIRISKIGRGGMGEVWKAWDTQLNRWVALKFLTEADAHGLMLFQTEAHLTANLSHPNIAAIHDYGKAHGLYYIAMQLVEGRSLDKAGKIDTRRAAGLAITAARAVHFAHGQGILHRDIKPANLMVTEGGHLYVMDFGLAARADSIHDPDFWSAGTEPFASPQQALGFDPEVRDDVYSLGVTLRALLPRKVPAALNRIILKSTAQEPEDRYQTAEAFARDLENYLRRMPRWRAAAAAALLVAIAGGSTFAVVSRERAHERAVALSRLGESHLQKKDLPGAVKFLTESIDIRPTAVAHLFRGWCYWQMFMLDEAERDIDAALVLDPTNQDAKDAKAILNR